MFGILFFCLFYLLVSNVASAVDYHKGMLGNGMEVHVIENHRSPVVMNMVWYRVGGLDDPLGKTGMAHYLEHMMFGGTKAYTDFSKSVMAMGGEFNAMTGSDYTVYYETVPKDKMESVMAMEADRMHNVSFSKNIASRERHVVAEERKMRVENVPNALLEEEMLTTFYKNGYGRPVVGWQSEIEALDLDSAKLFYNRYYNPSNALLLVVGDVTFENVIKVAERTYGRVQDNHKDRVVRNIVAEPEHRFTSRVVIDDNVLVKNQEINIWYKAPSILYGGRRKCWSLALGLELLAGRKSSYLYEELVLNKKLANSITVEYVSESLSSGRVEFRIIPRDGVNYVDMIDAFDSAVQSFLVQSVSESDLRGVAYAYKANKIYELDGITSISFFYGQRLFLGESFQDPEGFYGELQRISADDVRDSLRDVFASRVGRVEGILLPVDDD